MNQSPISAQAAKWSTELRTSLYIIVLLGSEEKEGFEILTAWVMKSFIFWDISLCSPLKESTFWRNLSPPSSGSKNKPSRKPA
jgi:hypothetical protein